MFLGSSEISDVSKSKVERIGFLSRTFLDRQDSNPSAAAENVFLGLHFRPCQPQTPFYLQTAFASSLESPSPSPSPYLFPHSSPSPSILCPAFKMGKRIGSKPKP